MSNPVDPGVVFVVVPAFNEHGMIRNVVENLLVYQYRVIVVDDGSNPPLAPLLQNLPLYILRHKVNLGQGAALQTGIEFAQSKNASYIVTFDADGQHQAADIALLLEPLLEDIADIVTGSRFMEGSKHNMTWGRRLLVQAARYMNYLFTGLLMTDAHNGLRAMNRKAAAKMQLEENGMAHATELLSVIRKSKLRHLEKPVHIHYTSYSRAKGQSAWSSFRVFFDLLLNKIFK